MPTAKRLPSGSWRVLVYLGKDEHGKQIRQSITAPTKKEAQRAAALCVSRHEQSARQGKTVGEILRDYIDIKNAVLSPSTVLGYEHLLASAYDDILDVPASSLTAASLQAYVNDFAKDHAPKTAINAWSLLSSALALYRPDFAPKIRLPQKRRRAISIPTDQDVAAYLAAVRGDKLELPVLLAVRCGLRASEISGLRVRDVDRKRQTITIRQARVQGMDGPALKAPKSDAGYRTIPCSAEICALIPKRGEFVTEMDSNAISSAWCYMVRKHNLRLVGFHSLRHYYASRAALLGIPKPYLIELMGHSSSRMLDEVYVHTFPDVKARYARILADAEIPAAD